MEMGLTESRVGPQKLSHRHEDIARWLVENPTEKLSVCAAYFGYTQSWLSCIIHSDAFQAKLRKMQIEADAVTVLDVPARLRGVAANALDALGAQVELAVKDGNGVMHREFLLNSAELTLKSLGYGSPKTTPAPGGPAVMIQQNNFGPVPPQVLGAARERLLNMEVPPALPEASELHSGDEPVNGGVQREAAAIPASPSAKGPEASGLDLRGESR